LDRDKLKELLENVHNGTVSIDEALMTLKTLPYEDLGFAMVDSHRSLRKGYPEVIFCRGKTVKQIRDIAEKLAQHHRSFMLTKADEEIYGEVSKIVEKAEFNKTAGIILVGEKPEIAKSKKKILIITAGTSDIPVAEEAAFTAEVMGNDIIRLYDVGVAGIHRLFDNVKKIINADIIIVIAGMDGALPSIIGGLVDKPVIAVPTSVGYGANFDGLSALLTMLNSCAPGVVVVNIDNGFGAGYFAGMLDNIGK